MRLTENEITILLSIHKGETAKQTGKKICRSPRTVETIVISLCDKFNCKNKTELSAFTAKLTITNPGLFKIQ